VNPASLLSALLTAPASAGDNWFFLPEQASTFAAEVDTLFNFINLINLIFFVGLMGAMFFFAVAYRQRNGQHHKTSPNKGHHQLEIAWSVGPGVLLLLFFYAGFKIYVDMRIPPAEAMEVRVTGQKWKWTFTYIDPETKTEIITGDLVVPVNTPVQLTMNSVDVLHSFYVPAFRVKQDVVPNRYTTLWFEAIKEGDFQVFCTEYCGTDHSRMLTKARVLSQDAWEDYIQTELDKGAAMANMSPAERGQNLFTNKYGCNACHSVNGTRLVGPTLKGKYGTEEQLEGGGTVTIDDNYIRESIMVPAAKIVAGFPPAMPSFQGRVSDEEMVDMLEYIKSLAE
jgi:cytochrome c oxidase subunit 2